MFTFAVARLSAQNIFPFKGPLQPFIGRRRLSWASGPLPLYAIVRYNQHFNHGFVLSSQFLRERFNIHDGVRLGPAERRCKDELSGIFTVQCSVSTVGDVDVQCSDRKCCCNGYHWYLRGPYVLFSGIRLSSYGIDPKVAHQTSHGATCTTSYIMRDTRECHSCSPPSRLTTEHQPKDIP